MTVGGVRKLGVAFTTALTLAGAGSPVFGADASARREEPARAAASSADIARPASGRAAAASADIGPWQVKAPRTGQWTAKRRSKDGIAWVRDDGSIAYFQAFPLPRVANEQAFISEVRIFTAKVLAGSGKGKIVDAVYALDRGRSYPCVKATLAVEAPGALSAPTVTGAAAAPGGTAPGAPADAAKTNVVRVQSRALICHSTTEPEVGVFIGFSYPGAAPSRALEADAQSFINGATLAPGAGRKWER